MAMTGAASAAVIRHCCSFVLWQGSYNGSRKAVFKGNKSYTVLGPMIRALGSSAAGLYLSEEARI